MVQKVDSFVERRIAASRAAFGELALEFFIPLLEEGRVAVVNGKVVFQGEPTVKAA